MAKSIPLARAFALIRALRAGRQTVDELSVSLGVPSRIVRSDIKALIAGGVPVSHDGEKAAIYWIERDWRI